MKRVCEMNQSELNEFYAAAKKEYEACKAKGLSLNMARGKPSKQQLDLVSGILTALTSAEECVDSGVDARNYGELKGLESARKLFADILGCKTSQVFAGGNSSLQLMYDTVSKAYTHGLLHSEKPWCKEESVKWLCPAPGYDRHFKVTESFGFELITIPMTENGPDMDIVENLIKDPSVKGMWNVPKYSNPDGIIYSDETIERIAKMKPAAPDFLLMWDNAYCIHEFDGEFVPFKDILSECEKYGNADMVFEFASTSKVTLPGAGIACFACSEANMEYMTKLIGIQAISFDKMNQLRHVKYLQNKEHTLALMKEHAKIMKPKFDMVVTTADKYEGDEIVNGVSVPTKGLYKEFQDVLAVGPNVKDVKVGDKVKVDLTRYRRMTHEQVQKSREERFSELDTTDKSGIVYVVPTEVVDDKEVFLLREADVYDDLVGVILEQFHK